MIEAPTYTYRLTRVYDLREWDEGAECYIPIPDEMKNQCDRCQRLHNKVYEVRRLQDGREYTVGSGCCKKLFGWEPEAAEVKRLMKEAEKQAKERGRAKLEAIAAPIAEQVRGLDVPEIVYLGTKYSMQVPCYGMRDSRVEVSCHDGLNDERRECCIHAWKNEQVNTRCEALYPRIDVCNEKTGLLKADVNWRKRYKVERIVKDMLEIW